MNPILDQVMGRRAVQEDDGVPLPCAVVPRRTFRDRQRRQEPPEPEHEDESMAADLKAVLGEANEHDERDEIIPQDAEEIDGMAQVTTARLNPIKDVVQEPSHPSGEKEKYLTPYAALTAPDATPDGMTPIDPSQVPGAAPPSKFTWSELQKATPEPPAEASAPASNGMGQDMAVQAMDVLLGRDRNARPAKDQQEMAAAGAIATEEAALAAMGVENPVITEEARAKAAAALVANPDPTGQSLMPDHKTADIKKVCEAARKWI